MEMPCETCNRFRCGIWAPPPQPAIQRSLEWISRDRTTIAIAHRLSTIRNADRIHLREGGRIVEQGTHEELVERDGVYSRLWRVQTGSLAAAG
jgi:ATP-binding cassette, subfamily B, bacterial